MKTSSSVLAREIAWETVRSQLDDLGFVSLPGALTKQVCQEITSYYSDDRRFRSRIDMARYAFGRGEYKYFSYPLPAIVQELRCLIYPELAPLANEWALRLRNQTKLYPKRLEDFLDQCHRQGQRWPTPLLLKYGAGDYNCLHQDLYGDIVFPFQATFFLSEPGRDFAGGQFILAEQRPRQQTRVEVLAPRQGDAVIFSVSHRPVRGARGDYRATLRHGVSTVRSGSRYTLGIIFHDAK